LNFVLRLILMLAGHHAKMRFLREAKKMGTLAYLRALQGSRRLAIAALGAFLVLQFMVLAAFGALVTGFMLWDQDYTFKLQVLFAIFAGMFALPASLLVILFSERLWYRASGAEKLVDDLRRD